MRTTTIPEHERLDQASETLARLEHEFTGEALFTERGPGRAVVMARGLSRTYGKGDASVHALRDVDIDITEGRLTAIMGPSGSGKSTLMHILAGLDQPTGGRVSIDGVEITRLKEKRLTRLRRDKIGFIFQSFNLLATLTARREHRPAAVARPPHGGRGLAARRHRGRRPAGPPDAPPGRALRRPAAARRRRPGTHHPPGSPVRRRTDRQPRLPHRRRSPRPAPPQRRRVRPDRDHGHPRRQRSEHRRPRHLPQGRPHRTGRGPHDPRRHLRHHQGSRGGAMTRLAFRSLASRPAPDRADRPRDPARRGDDHRHLRADRPDRQRVRQHHRDFTRGHGRADRAGTLVHQPRGRSGPDAGRRPRRPGAGSRRASTRRPESTRRWAPRSSTARPSRPATPPPCSRPSKASHSTRRPWSPAVRSRSATRSRSSRASPTRPASSPATRSPSPPRPASRTSRSPACSSGATPCHSGGTIVVAGRLQDVQRWSGEPGRISRISVSADPGVTPKELAADVKAAMPAGVSVKTGEQAAADKTAETTDAIGSFLTPVLLAFAGVSVFVGAFIIFNAFSITVAQRRREFAMLRALGANRRQVLGVGGRRGAHARRAGLGGRHRRRPRCRQGHQRALQGRRRRHPDGGHRPRNLGPSSSRCSSAWASRSSRRLPRPCAPRACRRLRPSRRARPCRRRASRSSARRSP